MFLEVAKPVTFILCILTLYASFHAAFLNPASHLEQRAYASLALLALAAGISLISGLIFRQGAHSAKSTLVTTLPVQMFCWASSVMLILFIISEYLESHCVFYRDVRF